MTKIIISDLQHNDVVSNDVNKWRFICTDQSNMLWECMDDSIGKGEFFRSTIFAGATSWKRNGEELLKKELVPVSYCAWGNKNNVEKYDKAESILLWIWGMKEALKDNSNFINEVHNVIPQYDTDSKCWAFAVFKYHHGGLPTFTDTTGEDIQQVLDYLNKNFKSGWKV